MTDDMPADYVKRGERVPRAERYEETPSTIFAACLIFALAGVVAGSVGTYLYLVAL